MQCLVPGSFSWHLLLCRCNTAKQSQPNTTPDKNSKKFWSEGYDRKLLMSFEERVVCRVAYRTSLTLWQTNCVLLCLLLIGSKVDTRSLNH